MSGTKKTSQESYRLIYLLILKRSFAGSPPVRSDSAECSSANPSPPLQGWWFDRGREYAV